MIDCLPCRRHVKHMHVRNPADAIGAPMGMRAVYRDDLPDLTTHEALPYSSCPAEPTTERCSECGDAPCSCPTWDEGEGHE